MLPVAAPLSVVVTLDWTENVLYAFVVYHVGFCLAAPLAESLVFAGHDVHGHRYVLGLGERPDRRILAVGAASGTALFVGILVPVWLAKDLLLAEVDVAGRLAAWGVPAGAEVWLFAYMLVFNSGAEELLWRGYVQTRLTEDGPLWPSLLLLNGLFASYHFYTLIALLGGLVVPAVMTAGVFVGGLHWSWLRARSGTVLAPVLSHVGATAGYITAYVLWFA